jgi:mono/diheme cytochrome c family protein
MHMGELRSVFHGSCWWRAAVAVIVAATAGASQETPRPARVAKPAPVARPATIDYQRDVHAIFAAHCLACHNADKRSGGLSLGTYQDITTGGRTGAAIKPGSSGQSLLVRRVLGEVQPAMPLGGDPLTSAEVATLRTWIDEGARVTPTSAIAKARWEPPLELVEPAIPHVTWAGWTAPLDRFTAAYLAKQGVAQPIPVNSAEFARRAYLDIWGLLPTPEETRSFVASTDPNKRDKLVASLLANPVRYSEHWISYWNDLLRNDEGVAYIAEIAQRKSITPWLLDALEKNKPYNQMVRELLNPTAASDPEGFLIGVNWRGTVSASQAPPLQASQNAAQIFLGINFKCNSCHDSFISRWKLKDAYALAAYFSAEEKLQLYRCDVAQPGQFATAGYMYPELNRPLPSGSILDRRAAIAAIFTDPRNGRVPRAFVNRVWEKLMGRGIVADVDDMDGEPWSPELLDYLAADFVKNGYDIKRLIGTIVASKTYRMRAVARPDGPPAHYSFRGPELRRLTAEQFADAVASVTGDWHVARPRAAPPNPAAAAAASTAAAATNAALANANVPGVVLAPDGTKLAGVFSGAPVDTEENLTINHVLTRSAAEIAANRAVAAAAAAAGRGAPTPPTAPPPPPPVAGGNYAREWRIAASNLTRALGRPIRDQVYTSRDNQATSMQAVELVNGETLNHWIWRGAQKMLGELPPEPVSLFSRQVNGDPFRPPAPTPANSANTGAVATGAAGAAPGAAPVLPVIPVPPPQPPPPPVPFSIDVSQSQKLYLIVEDNLSTAPDKAAPIWLHAFFTAADGSRTPLTALRPVAVAGLREDSSPIVPLNTEQPVTDTLRVKFPSELVYDISGRGFVRFEGIPFFEHKPLIQGEGVTGRFFVFDQRPSLDRLAPPTPETPVAPLPVLKTSTEAVDRVYWYLLGRAPSPAERQVAVAALRDPARPNSPSAAGLADLLWSVIMSPEFQFIR